MRMIGLLPTLSPTDLKSAEDVGSDFALAFAFVVKYGASMEDIIAQWIADECMTNAKANTIRKHAKSDHPMMRDLSTISLDKNMPLLEG